MGECAFCSYRETHRVLYEDDDVSVLLDPQGAAPGHTIVIPRQHIPIFEQIPDPLTTKLFSIANKVSTALFDTMQIQGTNLFVTNGVSAGQQAAHFAIQVIPRTEGDNINLQWQPRQLSEEEMSTVELKIKEGMGSQVASLAPSAPKQEAQTPIKRGENNYWKSVNNRIP